MSRRNKPRVHRKYRTKYKISNWPDYDRALAKRGSLTLWISDEAIQQWKPAQQTHRGGQLRYSDLAIQAVLSLRLVFHLPLRQAEGFVHSVFELMELDLPVPDHTTLSRRNRSLRIRLPKRTTHGDQALIVDSSGLKLVTAHKWQRARHRTKFHRRWRKLHIAVDGEGHIISSKLTGRRVDDASVTPKLIQNAGMITTFIGDGAYDDRRVYAALSNHQRGTIKVVVPPRKTAVLSKSRRRPARWRNKNVRWRKRVGKRQWQKEAGYHQQAHAENTFYRYKTIFGGALRARLFASQQRESQLGCSILNRMAQLGMPASEKSV